MGAGATLFDVEMEISALCKRKELLITELKTYEQELGRHKSRIRSGGRIPDSEYKAICKRQNQLRLLIQKNYESLKPIKDELRDLGALSTGLRAENTSTLSIVSEHFQPMQRIIELRNKYLDFAEDQTRVNSMRVMAAQFANELTSLIGEQQQI